MEPLLEKLTGRAKDPKITIFDLTVTRENEMYTVSFRVWFTGRKQDKRRSAFCAELAAMEGVQSVSNSSAETKV